MDEAAREAEIVTGRRAGDGRLRLYLFAEELLALSLEGQGERAPALLLTRAQVKELQAALARLLPLLREQERAAGGEPGQWQGAERRSRLAS